MMKAFFHLPGRLDSSKHPAAIPTYHQDDHRAVTIIEKFEVLQVRTESTAGAEEARQAAMQYPKQGKAATALLRKRKRQANRRSEAFYANIDR